MRSIFRPAVLSLIGVITPASAMASPIADPPVMHGKVVLTIGGENEQRPEYEFGSISGLAFDEHGQIYVSDLKENHVQVFSSSGSFAFTIGRKGAGPGEFYSPQSTSVASDGSLWVQDGGNRRITVFRPIAPAGKLIQTIPNNTTRSGLDRLHWDEKGNVVVPALASNTTPGQPLRVVRTFLNSDGVVVRTDSAPVTSPDSNESWQIKIPGGMANYGKPFAAQRLMAFGGQSFAAYATNTRYAIRIVDGFGKQTALIKRELPVVKLSSADVASFDATKERVAQMTKQPLSALGGKTPVNKPAIANLWFDMEGRLWVEQAVTTGARHQADVYSANGRWLSTMTWPENVSLANGAIRGNTGLGIATNAEGLQSVVRITWQ